MVDIFQEAGLPLWLRPYEVLVTSSYTALIETIPDTVTYVSFFLITWAFFILLRIFLIAVLIIVLQASIHSIKSRFPDITSLHDFYVAKYQENSPTFKLAQVKIVMKKVCSLCALLLSLLNFSRVPSIYPFPVFIGCKCTKAIHNVFIFYVWTFR